MERPPIQDLPEGFPQSWVNWFTILWGIAGSVDNSGTTAQRPTKGLFNGRPYFDTTLGFPIWLKSVSPTVWCRYDGTSV